MSIGKKESWKGTRQGNKVKAQLVATSTDLTTLLNVVLSLSQRPPHTLSLLAAIKVSCMSSLDLFVVYSMTRPMEEPRLDLWLQYHPSFSSSQWHLPMAEHLAL
jgi:hypothetical protein